jgi:hypothetical protein
MIHFHDDPTLEELLGDPITQAVMTADRVDPRELKAMLASIARAIGRRQGAWALRDAASGCVSEPRIRSHQLGAR